MASNATFKDSTNVWLFCKVGTYAISYGCNADTTVVTMLAAPAKQYTMGHVTPGRFDQSATASDDDGSTFRRFTRNTLGLRDSVMLGPLTIKYVFDPFDGLRTVTSLPNTSTRTDQYTTNNESYNWTYTDTTVNPLYRQSERFDSLGRISSEVMGYPYAQWASSYQLNRRPAYDSLGRVRQVNWSDQSCMAWPGSNPDSLSADQGWRYACSPTPIFSETYTYDAVGNRTDNSMAIHTGNRLYTVAWAAFEYDADGNMIRRTNTSTGAVDAVLLGCGKPFGQRARLWWRGRCVPSGLSL